jgi:succinate dehydrogenase / fumarate reductase cytochrome b subunit
MAIRRTPRTSTTTPSPAARFPIGVIALVTPRRGPYTAGVASATTRSNAAPRPFFRARIGSVVAVFPLAVWLFFHLWNNLEAFRSPDAWEQAVTTYSSPFSQLFSFIVVLLPIVLHTLWGIGRLLTSRPNNVRYTFFANTKYLLQRLAAVGVLLFIGAHLWLATLHPRLATGRPEPFSDISHEMATHMPTLIVYVLGTLGVAYHLGNGVATFAMGWGLAGSRRALKRMDWIAWLVFVVFLGMSWAAIYALWSAGRPA